MRSILIALAVVSGCSPEINTAFTSAVEKCANAQGWSSQKSHQQVWEACAEKVREKSTDGSVSQTDTPDGPKS